MSIPFRARQTRTHVVPDGVDTEALREATPFGTDGVVVLAVDRLDGQTSVRRAIAAMPSLEPEFRLMVVGDGPGRDRLAAYAADLAPFLTRAVRRVGVGRRPQPVAADRARGGHARQQRGSGSQVTEARAAGASVVASDLPIHREAAERPGGSHVIFVAPNGSPLDVADAIDEAARVLVLPSGRGLAFAAPSWQSVVDSTLMLYDQLIGDGSVSEPAGAHGALVSLAAEAPLNGDGVAVSGRSGLAGGTGG